MEFIKLELSYREHMILNVTTQANVNQFVLYGPVADPQELAHQAALFVAVHLRPYFDSLPVVQCQLIIQPEVPPLVHEACKSELQKLLVTNELLLRLKEDDEIQVLQQSNHLLCIYTEMMPLEGLLNLCDLHENSAKCIGYLPSSQPNNMEEEQLRLFHRELYSWIKWYAKLQVRGIYTARDFVTAMEEAGLVLSCVLKYLGQELIVVEGDYPLGNPLTFFQNRAQSSQVISRYVQDIQSLIWSRWLDIPNTKIGTLKYTEDQFDPVAVIDGFRTHNWKSLPKRNHLKTQNKDETLLKQNENLSFLICEDLYLRRLQQWLPQAYFVKGLLEKELGSQVSMIASIDIWQAVMRRLIVGSNESTDYDIVVLVRRMELITEAARTLAIIDFIANLKGKAQVHLCGHPDWQQIFPQYYKSGYSVLDWQKAVQKYQGSTFMQMDSVLHPALSQRCAHVIANGQNTALFSTLHQVSALSGEELPENIGVDWLQHHNVTDAKTACIHAMTASSERESMLHKRQSIMKVLHQHNQVRSSQLAHKDNVDVQTILEHEINEVTDSWHKAGERFYNLYPNIFQQSLMVLNPQVNFNITDELKENAPEYLDLVLNAEYKKYG